MWYCKSERCFLSLIINGLMTNKLYGLKISRHFGYIIDYMIITFCLIMSFYSFVKYS